MVNGKWPAYVPGAISVYLVSSNPAEIHLKALGRKPRDLELQALRFRLADVRVDNVGSCTPVTGSLTTPAACRSAQIVSNNVKLKRSLPSAKSERMPNSVFFNVDGLNGGTTVRAPMIGAEIPPELKPSE